MTVSDTILVNYWKVAGALCRGLHEVEQDNGPDVASSVLNLLVIELDKALPGLAWENVMTDQWPLRREQFAQTYYGRLQASREGENK